MPSLPLSSPGEALDSSALPFSLVAVMSAAARRSLGLPRSRDAHHSSRDPVARPSSQCHRAGQPVQDLHVYDPAAMAWTDLSAASSGTPPSARYGHGFTSAGGKLYVHGGSDGSGEYCGSDEGRGVDGSFAQLHGEPRKPESPVSDGVVTSTDGVRRLRPHCQGLRTGRVTGGHVMRGHRRCHCCMVS